MAKKGTISFYNLNLEKAVMDFSKQLMEEPDKNRSSYSLFYPMIGKDYEQGKQLMVYSQYATNWKPVFKPTVDKNRVTQLVKKSLDLSQSKGCPLDWVNKQWLKQNLFRDFFWNVTYKMAIQRYGRTEDNWNNIVAWSTLYKIAPQDRAINNTEQLAQRSNCAFLFKEELSILQPKNALLITSLDNWAEPILKSGGIKYKLEKGEYIQATAAYRGTQIIIARKPFAGNHIKFIDEAEQYMV